MTVAKKAVPKELLDSLLADLGVKRLEVDRRLGRLGAEHVGRALEQLVLPVGDLIRMHIVQFRELGQRLVAAHGVERHLCFEYG